MPLTLDRYDVLLADPEHPGDPDHATEHVVAVLHGDQLRAELEAPKHAIKAKEQPMHYTTVLLWAGLMRTHVIDQPFQEFKDRLLAFDEADDIDQGDDEPTDADAVPTPEEEGTGPASSSSTSSPAPTGTPPTSTPV